MKYAVFFLFLSDRGIIVGMVVHRRLEYAVSLEGPMPEATLEQKRTQYKQALRTSLDRILNQLASMPEVEKVILFGSYAAGRRDLFTDLDLLVVMDTEQDFLERTADLYRQIQTDVDVDLLVYTPEEFENQQLSGFVRHALATGQVVYEKKRP